MMGALANQGVYAPLELVTKASIKKHGDATKDNLIDTLSSPIDEMLGDPSTYPSLDSENVAFSLFEWDASGEAAHFPPEISALGIQKSHYTAAQAGAFIKNVGSLFGDGKTIGQHYSGLPAYYKRQWIKAFYAGDFKEMYRLEVQGAIKQGKSHNSGWKHPGYSGNASTT
jgi:hypothetical protein